MQQEHADLCVCVVGKYIYAVAGRDYHNDLSAVERYDPATNSWDYVAPLKKEVRKPSHRNLPNFFPWAIFRGPDVEAGPGLGPGKLSIVSGGLVYPRILYGVCWWACQEALH